MAGTGATHKVCSPAYQRGMVRFRAARSQRGHGNTQGPQEIPGQGTEGKSSLEINLLVVNNRYFREFGYNGPDSDGIELTGKPFCGNMYE